MLNHRCAWRTLQNLPPGQPAIRLRLAAAVGWKGACALRAGLVGFWISLGKAERGDAAIFFRIAMLKYAGAALHWLMEAGRFSRRCRRR
ncbi:MAG: hypothetical protein HYZ65_10250 [Burkholderiales bacterium]|nr:hypothetical protein [Burkholderiales bacterium]